MWFCLTGYILSNFICGAMCRRSWSCGFALVHLDIVQFEKFDLVFG